MKLLNISFYVIRKEEYTFLRYRHKIDSRAYTGFDVSHIRLYDGKFKLDQDHSDEVFFKAKPNFFNLPFSMALFIRRAKPAVVLLHGFIFPVQTLMIRLMISRETKIMVQHHAEKPFKNKVKLWLQKKAYRNLNAYLFSSSYLANDYLREDIVENPAKIHEVMEGSTTFLLQNKMETRVKLGLDSETIFLWVGRLDTNKDPLTVIKAIAELKKTGKSFKLYMIYGSVELEYELKQFVKENFLEENVFFVGKIPHEELEQWFSAADYFIAASHYEGSGIALCEAMSCGCIPIVTRIPSFVSMTDNGKCGYLFEPLDSNGLFKILSQLDPKDKEEAINRSLEKFKRDLSLEAIGNRIFSIASKLMQK